MTEARACAMPDRKAAISRATRLRSPATMLILMRWWRPSAFQMNSEEVPTPLAKRITSWSSSAAAVRMLPLPTAMRATPGAGNTRDSPVNISISAIWPSSPVLPTGA
ncbi:hypothetical protein FQZ97_1117820 [compost metagenome]